MFGWSIIASAWRSASKRAITCLVSMPSLMTFSATLRRTGSLLLGHVDDAHAALADLLQELVGADRAARSFLRARDRRALEETAGLVVGREQRLDPRAQVGVVATGTVEVGLTLRYPASGRGRRGRWSRRGGRGWFCMGAAYALHRPLRRAWARGLTESRKSQAAPPPWISWYRKARA